MEEIVRQVGQSISKGDEIIQLPIRVHENRGLTVESQLILGIEPRLRIRWAVSPRFWARGFKLYVFRSPTGFCATDNPDNLNLHGQLIIETLQDARYDEQPSEGTHYFTFALQRKFAFGLLRFTSIVRFSETIPSAKVALGRIKDQIDLHEMLQRREIAEIEHDAKLQEAELRQIRSQQNLDRARHPAPPKAETAAEAFIKGELSDVDAMIEAVFAKRRKIADLKNNPRFTKLSRPERQQILDRLKERLDAGEISARKEMQEHR